jgi:hypothetical protein
MLWRREQGVVVAAVSEEGDLTHASVLDPDSGERNDPPGKPGAFGPNPDGTEIGIRESSKSSENATN